MKSRTSRILAVILGLGGVFGALLALMLVFKSLTMGAGYVIFSLVYTLLFLWCIHVGLLLWQGEARGWRRAIVLYAAQIPMLATAAIRYEWYTGVELGTYVQSASDKARLMFDLNAGANGYFGINFYHGVPHFGINLFALLAVILLVKKRRQLTQAEDTTGPEAEA